MFTIANWNLRLICVRFLPRLRGSGPFAVNYAYSMTRKTKMPSISRQRVLIQIGGYELMIH